MNDIFEGLKVWRLWSLFSWHDLVLRYHSSILGTTWIAGNFLVLVLVKVIVFGLISDKPIGYFAGYVTLGFLVWQFINQVIIDGTQVFVSARHWLLGVKMPTSAPIYQSLSRNCIILAISGVAAIGVLLYYGATWSTAIWAIPGLAFLIFTGFWVEILLGVICTKQRDVAYMIQSVMRVMFFLTPILWTPSQMGHFGQYAKLNPFYHYIEIVRSPMIDGSVPVLSWVVCIVVTLLVSLVAAKLYSLSYLKLLKWI